jgi:hypothetical protein
VLREWAKSHEDEQFVRVRNDGHLHGNLRFINHADADWLGATQVSGWRLESEADLLRMPGRASRSAALALVCVRSVPCLGRCQSPPMISTIREPCRPGTGKSFTLSEHNAEATTYELPLLDINYGAGDRLQLKFDTRGSSLTSLTAVRTWRRQQPDRASGISTTAVKTAGRLRRIRRSNRRSPSRAPRMASPTASAAVAVGAGSYGRSI